jgi:hypothetical protein
MREEPFTAENWLRERGYYRIDVLLSRYKEILRSDAGVVTVEWVALAAALLIGSIAVAYIMMDGIAGAASSVANDLKDFGN